MALYSVHPFLAATWPGMLPSESSVSLKNNISSFNCVPANEAMDLALDPNS